MIRVKVCGMRDSLNIKEIAEAGPEYLGFIFHPLSPRYIGDEMSGSFFSDLPSGTKKVGVFVNEDYERIVQLSKTNGLSVIQLHGTETPSFCSNLKSTGLNIIKVFNIDDGFDFESVGIYMQVCDFFLFDTKSVKAGGSGLKFKWEKLSEYTLDKPFFLSGGIGPEDAGCIKEISNRGLFAVDINSRFETAPGLKNATMVRSFINTLKNDRI